MNTDLRFAKILKRLREYRGISQERLAEYAKRSTDAISNLERGVSLPSYDMIIDLADAMDLPPSDFFPTTEDEKQSELLSLLLANARDLSDSDLKIAIDQVSALRMGRG